MGYNTGTSLGDRGHFPLNLWKENEKLYYVSVLSDTAKKMKKM